MRIKKSMKNEKIKIIEIIPSKDYIAAKEKAKQNTKKDTYITYPTEYNKVVYTHFKRTAGDEGLEMINSDVISNQRSAFGYVLSQISKNLINGRFTLAYSLPISVFDCRTSMEFFAWNLQLIPKRIVKCIDDKCDIVERLKQLTIFLITMNRINLPYMNPLLPTLGETFQCQIEDIQCYFETTKVNPPIFNFYLFNQHFKAYGHWYLSQTQGANSMINDSCGEFKVKFMKDNEEFTFTLCTFSIFGILFGKNTVSLRNNITVSHEKSGMISCINLNPVSSGFFGWFGGNKAMPDAFNGFIAHKDEINFDSSSNVYSMKEGKKPIGNFTGEWSEEIKYNDKIVWTKSEDDVLSKMKKMEFILPSDSLFREDSLFLRTKDETHGEEAKAMIEEKEKADEYLREEFNK